MVHFVEVTSERRKLLLILNYFKFRKHASLRLEKIISAVLLKPASNQNCLL